MKKSMLAALLTLLASCASAPPAPQSAPIVTTPAPVAPSAGDHVQQLTGYPTSDYDNLGTVSFRYFRQGYRTPSISDALSELKTRVREAGGNAFILVQAQPDHDDKRTLRVSAEVLRLK